MLPNLYKKKASLSGRSELIWPGNIILLLLMLIAAVPRIWVLMSTGVIGLEAEADSICRLCELREFVYQGKGMPGGLSWLPLHFVLMKFVYSFTGDVVEAGRVLSFISGLLFVVMMFKWTILRFGWYPAIIVTSILIIHPFFVKYSTLPFAEMPYMALVAIALYYLEKHLHSDNYKALFISGIALSLASLIRFEAWLLAALFPLLHIIDSRRIMPFIGYGITSALGIALYMGMSYSSTGTLFYGLSTSDLEVSIVAGNSHWLGYWSELLGNSLDQLGSHFFLILLIIATAIGVFYSKFRSVSAIFLLFFAVIAFKLGNQTLNPLWRYLALSYALSLPFLFTWIKAFEPDKKTIGFICLVILMVFGFRLPGVVEYLDRETQKELGYFESAKWLKEHRLGDEKVLLYVEPFAQCNWRLAANLTNGKNFFFPQYSSLAAFDTYQEFDSSYVINALNNSLLRFIVYKDNSPVDTMLEFLSSSNSQLLTDLNFEEVWQQGEFHILAKQSKKYPHNTYPNGNAIKDMARPFRSRLEIMDSIYLGPYAGDSLWACLSTQLALQLFKSNRVEKTLTEFDTQLLALAPDFPISIAQFYLDDSTSRTYFSMLGEFKKLYPDQAENLMSFFSRHLDSVRTELIRGYISESMDKIKLYQRSSVYELFGEPGTAGNTDWMSLSATIHAHLEGRFLSIKRNKQLIRFFEDSIPSFPNSFTHYISGEEGKNFERDARDWAKHHPEEVKKTELFYERAYNKWISDQNR